MSKPATPKKPTASPVQRQTKSLVVLIDRIDVPAERQREFQPAVAEGIAGTLPSLGLQHAIGVSATGERFRLVYGLHRLEAAKMAGWDTIPVHVIHLDENDMEASAGLHEAVENLLRADLSALDRMAQLSVLKAAHDRLYPNTSKGGRPRTRADEENLDILPQFSFSKTAAVQIGLDRRSINRLTGTWDALSPAIRRRLRGSRLQDKQSELFALARLEPTMQDRVLDYILSDAREAETVEEARALVMNEAPANADQRRMKRYQDTIRQMGEEDRNALFDGMEDVLRAYAERKGWTK